MKEEKLLLGLWRFLLPVPRAIWQTQIKGDDAQLDFMSADHHRVRNFCVVELPRVGKPLEPAYISGALGLPLERVVPIRNGMGRPYSIYAMKGHEPQDIIEALERTSRRRLPVYSSVRRITQLILEEYLEPRGLDEISLREIIRESQAFC